MSGQGKEVYEFGPFRIAGRSVDCLVCATFKFWQDLSHAQTRQSTLPHRLSEEANLTNNLS